jgi:hypothetical protein
MGRRLPPVLVGVVATLGLLALPASAGACASLGGVHSFSGHAFLSFSGTASGPIEGSGGGETISLQRQGASLELNLNHRSRGKGQFSGIVFFGGRVRMGALNVDDEFAYSGGGGSGRETYSGPEHSPLGNAQLILDTDDCRYVLVASFGAETTFSGDEGLNPGPGVSVSAFGDRNKIPGNLHLIGGVGPAGYLDCPGDPLQSGQPCVEIGGGWSVDFAELKQCGSFPPQGNCASGDKPIGDGKFIWVLKPH